MNGVEFNHDPSKLPVPRSTAGLPSTEVGGTLPSGNDQEAGGFNANRIAAALLRGKWLILGLTALGVAAGVMSTRLVKPEYESSATIWIEGTSSGKGTPVQGDELLRPDAWMELLTKFKVLDPVVIDRRMYVSAANGPDSLLFRNFQIGDRFATGSFVYKVDAGGKSFELAKEDGRSIQRGATGDSVGLELGFKWVPHPDPAPKPKTVKFTVIPPRDASTALITRLKIQLKENNFLLVKLADPSASHAAMTLNTLIRRFVDEAGLQKKERLTQMRSALDQQLADQEARLHNAERELEQFRVTTVTLPREDVAVAPGLQMTQSTSYGDYFQLRKQIDDIKRDRRQLQDAMKRLNSGDATIDAFQTINAVRTAPALLAVLDQIGKTEIELRVARTRYTDEYKTVKDLIDQLTTLRTVTLPTYVGALDRQLGQQESDFEGRGASSARELHDIPTRSINEARLKRQVDQADMLFRSLDRSRQEARMAEASAVPEVRILDTAVVSSASKNTAPLLIALGLAAGLMLGIGLALLIDFLDRRVRYPDQVTHSMGLTIMGAIPAINHEPDNARNAEERAQVMEAFRTLRMNLAHAVPNGEPLSFTISSPSPGDGKSLISSNLVLSFAEAGFNTILIDGDTRRGGQHRTFNVEAKPGLLDYLNGDASIASITRPTFHPRLTVIPGGTRLRQAPELLGSSRMMELMNQLKSRFEVIIVDSPPLGAGIDPFVLGMATGAMLLVVRVGETDKDLTLAKLDNLRRLPIRILGGVLNDIKAGKGAYRYYNYSYGYAEELPPETAGELQKSGSVT